jgi:hypothetical protein
MVKAECNEMTLAGVVKAGKSPRHGGNLLDGWCYVSD